MRIIFTLGGAVALAMGIGAALNTQAWECGAVGDQFLGGIEYWGPGVVLPALVGATLLLRARKRTAPLDIGLLSASVPLDIYAAITWAASICDITGPA